MTCPRRTSSGARRTRWRSRGGSRTRLALPPAQPRLRRPRSPAPPAQHVRAHQRRPPIRHSHRGQLHRRCPHPGRQARTSAGPRRPAAAARHSRPPPRPPGTYQQPMLQVARHRACPPGSGVRRPSRGRGSTHPVQVRGAASSTQRGLRLLDHPRLYCQPHPRGTAAASAIPHPIRVRAVPSWRYPGSFVDIDGTCTRPRRRCHRR
jgi:hypothetical protein